MTLRLEVRQALLGGAEDHFDEPIDLDVDPHVFEMPYAMVQDQVKNDVKKDLNKHRRQEREKKEEGYRQDHMPMYENTHDDTPGGELHEAPAAGGPIPDHLDARGYHHQQPGQAFREAQARDFKMDGGDGLGDLVGLGDIGDVPEIGLDLTFADS